MARKAKSEVPRFKDIDEVGAALANFDDGASGDEVEVNVDKDGILSVRHADVVEYTRLGDTSGLDADDVRAAVDHYLCKDGHDIASLACSIKENAKTIEAMALSSDWDNCEEDALSILAAVSDMLVRLRDKLRAEEG